MFDSEPIRTDGATRPSPPAPLLAAALPPVLASHKRVTTSESAPIECNRYTLSGIVIPSDPPSTPSGDASILAYTIDRADTAEAEGNRGLMNSN